MKKILVTVFLFLTVMVFSQAPQKINYQGIARDASGMVLKGGNIGLRFEIYNPSQSELYSETQLVNVSPSSGVFVAEIGNGTQTSTLPFTGLTWVNGPYLLRVSADPAGGTNYSIIGTQELLSVPYALYAENTNIKVGNGLAISSGSIINTFTSSATPTITGSGMAMISPSGPSLSYTVDVPIPVLTVNGNTISITPGNSQNLPVYSLATGGSTLALQMNGGAVSTVTLPVAATASLIAGENINLNQTGNTYTVGTPSYSINFPGGGLVEINNGIVSNTTAIPPTNLTLSGPANNSLTAGGNTVKLNTYSPGNGLFLSGTAPDYTMSMVPVNSWSVGGNGGTNPAFNYLGTSDGADLVIKTSGFERMRISGVGGFIGNIGIRAAPSAYNLDIGGTVNIKRFLNMDSIGAIPLVSSAAAGRIFFDGTKFMVSENGSLYKPLFSPGPWTQAPGAVTLTTISNKVGIGISVPNAMLDVQGSGIFTSPIANFNNINSTNGATVVNIINNGSGNALNVNNSNASNGNALAVFNSSNGPAITASNGGLFHTLYSINSNVNLSIAAGFFDGGLITKGKNAINTGFTFKAQNSTNTDLFVIRNDGHVGVGTSSPTDHLQIIDNTAISSLGISNSNTGSYLAAYFSSNSSLYTTRITNDGTGHALAVYKPGAATGPVAQIFNSNAANGSDVLSLSNNANGNVLYSYNSGSGHGIYSKTENGIPVIASTGPALAARTSLLLDNGHLATTQSGPPGISGLGGNTVAFWNVNATDVAGIIEISTPSTPSAGPQVAVIFKKPYLVPPVVILTPAVNSFAAQAVSINRVFVTTTTTGFTIHFNTAFTSLTTMYFNYMVIETN